MELIVLMEYGADLYGTVNYQNKERISDTDVKGIGLPSIEQVASFNVPSQLFSYKTGSDINKNSKEDIDLEIICLKKWLDDACGGQTYCFDMMHAPKDKTLITSQIWDYIVAYRHKFYSKNISAMLGYAQSQCAKYGMRGSRLSDAENVLNWLENQNSKTRIKDCDLNSFPNGDHISPINSIDSNLVMIEVCSRKFEINCKVEYVKDIVKKIIDNYGERARLAKKQNMCDWKACSHAVRAALQVKELFTDNIITFPLKERETILAIKNGKWEYKRFIEYLEDLIDEVKELKDKSSLPDNSDVKFWNDFHIDLVKKYIFRR